MACSSLSTVDRAVGGCVSVPKLKRPPPRKNRYLAFDFLFPGLAPKEASVNAAMRNYPRLNKMGRFWCSVTVPSDPRRHQEEAERVYDALAPSSLEIYMDGSGGGGCMAVIAMLPDPSALSSISCRTSPERTTTNTPALLQILLIIMWMKKHSQNLWPTCMSSGPRRASKTPKSFKEIINSPEAKQWGTQPSESSWTVWQNTRSTSRSQSPASPRTREDPRHKVRLQIKGRRNIQGRAGGSRPCARIWHRLRETPRTSVRTGSVRALLAVVCEHRWPVWQMYVAVVLDVWVKPTPDAISHH